jgi:hypothetical protein
MGVPLEWQTGVGSCCGEAWKRRGSCGAEKVLLNNGVAGYVSNGLTWTLSMSGGRNGSIRRVQVGTDGCGVVA